MSKVVLFDVDGTVSDGQWPPQARPGIHDWVAFLHNCDYEVHLWSAQGGEYARRVATELGLDHVAETHDKPKDDLEIHALFKRLGTIWLIVDDDQDWLDRFPRMHRLKVEHTFALLHPGVVVSRG